VSLQALFSTRRLTTFSSNEDTHKKKLAKTDICFDAHRCTEGVLICLGKTFSTPLEGFHASMADSRRKLPRIPSWVCPLTVLHR
jgi:hypothetical protein